MTLNELAKIANAVAHRKGWYIFPKSFGDNIALFHTEISEAFEEFRTGRRPVFVYAGDKVFEYTPDDMATLETLAANGVKPEGVGVELADAVIRILDFAHEAGIDLDAVVRAKMKYNEGRTYRHGGKVM